MFFNLLIYCSKHNIDCFGIVPLTIIIPSLKDNVNYNFQSFSKLFNLIDYYIKTPDNTEEVLMTKKGLFFKNTKLQYFHFYNGLFSLNSNELNEYNNNIIYLPSTHITDKNLWIIKPSDLCQGKGMEVYDDLNKIHKKTKQFFNGVVVNNLIQEDDQEDKKEIKKTTTSTKYNDHYKSNYNNNQNIQNFAENRLRARKLTTVHSNKRLSLNDSNELNKQDLSKQDLSKHDIKNDSKQEEKDIKDPKDIKDTKKVIKYFSNFVIIQKYIENPYLYKNRKFDIRVWVLVTHELKVYMFKEGHIKTSSKVYDLNSKNTFIHITNYTLQKQSAEFSKFEVGNEASIHDLNYFIQSENPNHDYNTIVLPKIKNIIEITMKSVRNKLNKQNSKFCFEIYGYDFILDKNLTPWLLEINDNPGLCESSPLIAILVPRMLDDAFRLTLDKIFETEYDRESQDNNADNNADNKADNKNYKSPFKVAGYNNDNMFDYICSLAKSNKIQTNE